MSATDTTEKTFDKIETEIETEILVNNFFKFEKPDEISEKLALMLENYIAHAPVEKSDLASASYMVSRLTSFLYNLKEKSTKVVLILLPLIAVLNSIDFDF